MPTKIKTYTVTSSPNCQLLSTLFFLHLLHPLQICSAHSFSDFSLIFLHYHQYKTEHIIVYFKKNFFAMQIKSYPLQILSTSAPLTHSPYLLCTARSFSTSTPLHLLILHIHSTPLAYSPHSLHTLIDSFRQRDKVHMKASLHISSTLTLPVFKFKFLHFAPHQKRQVCVCYGVFQTSLHMNIKFTLRNMIGSLHCCYQKSPYQFSPHILVFVFKNYVPHIQADR